LRIIYLLIFKRKEAITATGKKNNEAIDDIFSTLKDKPKKKEKEELTKGVAFDKEKANKKSGGEKSKSIELQFFDSILIVFIREQIY